MARFEAICEQALQNRLIFFELIECLDDLVIKHIDLYGMSFREDNLKLSCLSLHVFSFLNHIIAIEFKDASLLPFFHLILGITT